MKNKDTTKNLESNSILCVSFLNKIFIDKTALWPFRFQTLIEGTEDDESESNTEIDENKCCRLCSSKYNYFL